MSGEVGRQRQCGANTENMLRVAELVTVGDVAHPVETWCHQKAGVGVNRAGARKHAQQGYNCGIQPKVDPMGKFQELY